MTNIDLVTILNTQWGYLGSSNQSIATTSDFTGNSLTVYDPAQVQWTGGDFQRLLVATGNMNPGGVPTWRTFDTIQLEGTPGFSWDLRCRYQAQAVASRDHRVQFVMNNSSSNGNITNTGDEAVIFTCKNNVGTPTFTVTNLEVTNSIEFNGISKHAMGIRWSS